MRTKPEVTHAFTPTKVGVSEQQRILRAEIAFRDLAEELYDLVPECADRTAALRKLLEAKMTCVQAITHCTSTPPAQKQATQTEAVSIQSSESVKEKGKNANKKEK